MLDCGDTPETQIVRRLDEIERAQERLLVALTVPPQRAQRRPLVLALRSDHRIDVQNHLHHAARPFWRSGLSASAAAGMEGWARSIVPRREWVTGAWARTHCDRADLRSGSGREHRASSALPRTRQGNPSRVHTPSCATWDQTGRDSEIDLRIMRCPASSQRWNSSGSEGWSWTDRRRRTRSRFTRPEGSRTYSLSIRCGK